MWTAWLLVVVSACPVTAFDFVSLFTPSTIEDKVLLCAFIFLLVNLLGFFISVVSFFSTSVSAGDSGSGADLLAQPQRRPRRRRPRGGRRREEGRLEIPGHRQSTHATKAMKLLQRCGRSLTTPLSDQRRPVFCSFLRGGFSMNFSLIDERKPSEAPTLWSSSSEN